MLKKTYIFKKINGGDKMIQNQTVVIKNVSIVCNYDPIADQHFNLAGYTCTAKVSGDGNVTLREIIHAMAAQYSYGSTDSTFLIMNLHDIEHDDSVIISFDDLKIFKSDPLKIYADIDRFLPNTTIYFAVKFTSDHYDDEYETPGHSDTIDNIIIKGGKALINYNFNILFDGIGGDDNNHILSAIWGVGRLFCASPDLTSNPSLNEKQLSYMVDFISSRNGRLMAAEVNSPEQYGALLKMGFTFFTGEFIKVILS